jgi:hypothetical protein
MHFAFQLLSIAGLIAGFIGTLMVAHAIGENPGGAYQMDNNIRRRIYLAAVNSPPKFRWGLRLIALGFALQCGAAIYQLTT